jgi:hypothetical protein
MFRHWAFVRFCLKYLGLNIIHIFQSISKSLSTSNKLNLSTVTFYKRKVVKKARESQTDLRGISAKAGEWEAESAGALYNACC